MQNKMLFSGVCEFHVGAFILTNQLTSCRLSPTENNNKP